MNPVKNQITLCSNMSRGAGEPGGIAVTRFIKKDTTPEAFDAKIASIAGYKLENGGINGWNALGVAAKQGNTKLVAHIVQKGGKHLLNLGNDAGMTPLFSAVWGCNNQENAMRVVKELIGLGADVNRAISCRFGDGRYGGASPGSTPLLAAAERTKDLEMVKLLLKHGAIKQPEEDFSEEGKHIIKTAEDQIKNQMEKERLFLAAYFKPENNESILQTLPLDVIKQIFELIKG